MYVFPSQVFFYPNNLFLDTMNDLDGHIIEMGCGVGHALARMKEYGGVVDNCNMYNSRGFDIVARTECEAPMQVAYGHMFDALEFKFYNKLMNVLVCRPDHGGWVGALLDQFLSGEKTCKRFIYVGLERNLHIDFDYIQLEAVSKIVCNVGDDEENMYIWEIP
ncbi:hypothetical protein [Acinetobacter phage vB_AbaP_HB01]|nr:hypothetical protein [Acinetobacter phage vB_AbaP_HB01]